MYSVLKSKHCFNVSIVYDENVYDIIQFYLWKYPINFKLSSQKCSNSITINLFLMTITQFLPNAYGD